MAGLEYVGRYPDLSDVVVPKSYVDTQAGSTIVTDTTAGHNFIDTTCANQAGAANLVSQAYVVGQVGMYATQAQVSAYEAANYVPLAALGGAGVVDNSDGTCFAVLADSGDGTATTPLVTNNSDGTATISLSAFSGVAKAGSDGRIPTGSGTQIPSPVTDSVAKCYDLSSSGAVVFLGSGSNYGVSGTTIYPMASIPIPDPGYAWIPFPFAMVLGSAGGTASSSRFSGNGNYGIITVSLSTSNSDVYAVGVCTADTRPAYYTAIPGTFLPSWTDPITPTTQRPIYGSATLNLNGQAGSGSAGYTFAGAGLVYFVMVYPAV